MSHPTLQTLLERRERFLAFVQKRVADRSLAEDILQVAYMRALEHSDTLREQESAVAWFYSVLRNAVVDHYRHHTSETSAMDRWARSLASADQTPPSPRPQTSPRAPSSADASNTFCPRCGPPTPRSCARSTSPTHRSATLRVATSSPPATPPSAPIVPAPRCAEN